MLILPGLDVDGWTLIWPPFIVLSVSMTGVWLPITSPCPAEGGTMRQCAPLLHGLSLLGRHCSLSSADTCDQLLLEVFNLYVDNMDIQNIQACWLAQ